MPKVSVLIPSFNHRQFVEECVESVLAQTHIDFEIVVVDDGSKDGSLEVLRAFGDKILLLKLPQKGTQAARNAAIAASSGEYLALLDSDDVWLPIKLERQVAVLDQRPDVGLVYSLAYQIDAHGALLNEGRTIGRQLESSPSALEQFIVGNSIPAPTAIFRRSCLDKVGGFDESFLGSGDWDLWLRISAHYEVAFIPEPLALYRLHEFNTTKALFKNHAYYEERYAVISKTMENYPRLIPDGAQRAAFVNANLWAAEAEAAAGNIDKAGNYLARAVEHDPQLIAASGLLMETIIRWANRYCGKCITGKRYQSFVKQICAPILEQRDDAVALYGNTLSEGAMRIAFEEFQSGDLLTVRSILPVAIKANPNWLRNRGVRSMAIQSFLGKKLTSETQN